MKILRHPVVLFASLLLLGVLSGCAPVTIEAPTASPLPEQQEPAQGTPEQLTPTAGQVEANGVTIAYESFGSTDNETILLIAGVGMQLVDWPIELVEELVSRGYRVVRFDNRDSGLSTIFTEAGLPDEVAIGQALEAGEPAPMPYTLQDMAEDAVGLLDALEIQQAHLVGASMGGAIAQLVAIDHPERTLSLTTFAADSGNPDLPVVTNPAAFEEVPPQPTTVDREAFIEWQVGTWQALAGSMYPTDEAVLREWAQRNFERGFDPDALVRHQTVSFLGHIETASYRLNNLENIEAPTVVLQGTEDPLVPVESAEDIAERVPDAELRIIPGLGHDIPVALVEEFADAIAAAATRANRGATTSDEAAPEFAALDQYIEEALSAASLPGLALAVTRGEEVLYLKGYGSAAGDEQVTPQTQFHIASVSKSFTALAVMQLVEAGDVNLDDPVQTYLPDFQTTNASHSSQITVRHLLNQTSGLDFSGFPMVPPDQQPTSLQELVELMREAEPISEPGAEFHYFDPNYGILARMVEVVSGEPFSEYLQTHIFAPLQMNDTISVITASKASQAAPNLAQGYSLESGAPLPQQEVGYLGGSGGIVSTAEDMANYLIMQNQGGRFGDSVLVNPDHVMLMNTPPSDIESPYAMGWVVLNPNASPRVLDNWGDLASFHADAVLLPDEGYGFVLLYNAYADPNVFNEIKAGIIDLIFGT